MNVSYFLEFIFFKVTASLIFHEMKLCVKAGARERLVWSLAIGRRGVGVSLLERRATMQVMLGVSLRARWDATLVYIIYHDV